MIGSKMNLKQAAVIANAIQSQESILMCGPNNCGATTLINGMIDCIPKSKNAIILQHRDELFTINHPEITIWHPIVSSEDNKIIPIDKLAETALELDTDYYILGDAKGRESYSLYRAANSGYTIWTMVRASSCENALLNLGNMIIDAYPVLNQEVVYTILSNSIKYIIYMEHNKIKDMQILKNGYNAAQRKFNMEKIL